MEFEWSKAIMLMLTGVAAGFINTVAGGGSLLTLPMFIFLGFDQVVANATNRVAILFQNIFAVQGFKSEGVFVWPYALWVGLAAAAGAIVGANIALDVSGDLFNKILGLVMVMAILFTFFSPAAPKEGMERLSKKHQLIAIPIFFVIGIYGGFIQAGVGFLIMSALSLINRINLVKVNSIKVFVVLCYTIFAVGIFAWEGKIDWMYGGILAVGNSSGGWFASRWSVKKGDKWIKRFLIIMVIIMALKLWGVPFLNP